MNGNQRDSVVTRTIFFRYKQTSHLNSLGAMIRLINVTTQAMYPTQDSNLGITFWLPLEFWNPTMSSVTEKLRLWIEPFISTINAPAADYQIINMLRIGTVNVQIRSTDAAEGSFNW